MKMRTAVMLLVIGAVAACGDDPCEPIYEGDATDEAWHTMVDAEDDSVTGDPNAPVIVEPAEGAALPADGSPLRVTWTSPLAASNERAPKRGWIGRAVALVESAFMGTAHAHEPPITGDVYYLQIDVPGRSCPVLVMTTELAWEASADIWAELQAAGGELTIRLTSAYLRENRITEGPYAPSADRTFRIGS